MMCFKGGHQSENGWRNQDYVPKAWDLVSIVNAYTEQALNPCFTFLSNEGINKCFPKRERWWCWQQLCCILNTLNTVSQCSWADAHTYSSGYLGANNRTHFGYLKQKINLSNDMELKVHVSRTDCSPAARGTGGEMSGFHLSEPGLKHKKFSTS